jgi:hypothetical protein
MRSLAQHRLAFFRLTRLSCTVGGRVPFTASHPMAVLPLMRWRETLRLDATCLLLGSMAPDFEYFVRGRPVGTFGHTLAGLVVLDLPATLIVAAVFHALVKWPLLLVAPAPIARRAVREAGRPWPVRWSLGALAACVVSAVLGAASHVGWDSFTHSNAWGPRHIHLLRVFVDVPWFGPVILHRVLQQVSSVVGLGVLGVAAARWLARATPAVLPALPRAAARGCVALCVLVGVAAMYARLLVLGGEEIGAVVVAGCDGILGGVVVASAILYRPGRRLRSHTTATVRAPRGQ